MKKINYFIVFIFLLILVSSCAGYKPLYTTNLKFEIADHTLKNNKKISQQIYSKLYYLSKSSSDPDAQSITVTIDTKKDKVATAKDDAGNVLEYRINLNSHIIIEDYLTGKELLNNYFSSSSSYEVQDQHSETIKLQNNIERDLVNIIYQNLITMMAESLLSK
tara:strand:+ start:433 stop:921 length:489 start_codon:yes stop_codon:yes gene_type:complete